MIITLLAIFQYAVQATVDLMDKFLISTRKIEPLAYTFYTVVMGLLIVLIWPLTYFSLPIKFILLNLLSGAFFSLVMYVFFKALSQGEASRVVPFVFGLVPVFDILISITTGRGILTAAEVAAMCLLIPGALLVSHQKHSSWGKHLALKTASAFLFSSYYALWKFGAQLGPTLNNLIWNRLGAAAVLLVLLCWPIFRKKIFSVQQKVPNKKSTAAMFLFKQVLGGANFIFLSFLFVLGKISIINALQGFRYIFLLLFSKLITKKRRHLIEEDDSKFVFTQKTAGIILIFLGTIFLFI
ncbi:MAG: hypothetical protein HY918_05145 [Candidatus Doudnabacteria bacterium]|nr:hypothetical protein [Candidatus Doudnabacteria bacterium]